MVKELSTETDLDFSEPPPPGKYHVVCIDVIEEDDDMNMVLTFEVLAGTVKHMEGRTKKCIFRDSTKMIKWIHRLAIVGGLITQEKLDDLKAKGEFAAYDFTKLNGRHFMIEITADSYEKDGDTKHVERIQPWHVWSVDDPKCANWPKNTKMLQKAGYDVKSDSKQESKPAESKPDMLDDIV